MKSVGRWGKVCFLAGGTGLLGFLVWRVGIEEVLLHVGRVGWGIVPVLCVSAIWKGCNTAGLMLAFPPDVKRPGFWRLYGINLAGDVVNNALPTANIGGELAKPFLMRAWTPVSESLPAVVANKTMEIVAGLVFAAVGAVVALLSLPLDNHIRLGLVVAILVGGIGIALLCLVQCFQPLSRLADILSRAKIHKWQQAIRQQAVSKIDEGLRTFYTQRRMRFFGCLGLRLFSFGLGMMETFLVLRFLGLDISLTVAFLLMALPMIIDTAFFFVPANVGTFEAGHTYVSMLLAFDPVVGLSLALVKRFRRLFWMGSGFVLLYAQLPVLERQKRDEVQTVV